MKKLAYISGIISLILISLGAMAKTAHWPGASMALVSGITLLIFLFLPAALINNYRKTGSKSAAFYTIVYLSAFLLFISALFKINHWPGAGLLMYIAIPFPFVVFIPMLFREAKKNEKMTLPNVISILFFMAFMALGTAFLSVNLSWYLLTEATIFEEEFQETAIYLKKSTPEKENSKLYKLASEISDQIYETKMKIVDMDVSAENGLQNPHDIPEKDNYNAVSKIVYTDNPEIQKLATKIDEFHTKVPEIVNAKSKQMYIREESKDFINLVGNNPKIWAIANLSFIESELYLRANLAQKLKILEENPE